MRNFLKHRIWGVALQILVAGISCFSLSASVYEVGPGKKLSGISQVPWESLNAGDEVQIFWREKPYKEKFVLCRQGRADAPITIRGVKGPHGELPVIDGEDAITRTNLAFWGDIRGVIKIGGATAPVDTMPRYILIENLDVRGSRPPFAFKAANGESKKYSRNAAAIYVEKAENLTIRNCVIHDSGNGVFVSSNNERASTNIVIESNYIYDNGNPGSGGEHNVYSEANGMIFQFNHFGHLKGGSLGNNLKDRSSGTIIRYNWIEDGNNVLDLVDAEGSGLIRAQPLYGQAFVYGNVIIKPQKTLHAYVVHYGGDSEHGSYYRKGPLYFFNNTVIIERQACQVFRLSQDQTKCDCRNNIFYSVTKGRAKPMLMLSLNVGATSVSHNWCSKGWKLDGTNNRNGHMTDDGTTITGTTPGFMNESERDFHLATGSPCINAGTNLLKEMAASSPLLREYVSHQNNRERVADGKLDIGAFEFSAKR